MDKLTAIFSESGYRNLIADEPNSIVFARAGTHADRFDEAAMNFPRLSWRELGGTSTFGGIPHELYLFVLARSEATWRSIFLLLSWIAAVAEPPSR